MASNILVYNDYVFCKKLDLNLSEIVNKCNELNGILTTKFGREIDGQSTMIEGLFKKYNLLTFPCNEFHQLYNEISTFWKECMPEHEGQKNQYYIQCWLNIFNEGQFIDWHSHWPKESNSWHGFYCVFSESSFTSYDYNEKVFHVPSSDNMLILSRSAGDRHKSSPWKNKNHPRMTIAFDIVTKSEIMSKNVASFNHWIPI